MSNLTFHKNPNPKNIFRRVPYATNDITFLDCETDMLKRISRGDEFDFDQNEPYTNLENWPRLLEVAAIDAWFLKDKSPSTRVVTVNQGKRFIKKMKPRPAGFDYLTPNYLEENGVHVKKALKEIHSYLWGPVLIVAHNAPFDIGSIRAEYHRNGMEQYRPLQVFDTKKAIFKKLGLTSSRNPNEGASLRTWAKYCGFKYDNPHNAEEDTNLLMHCFFETFKEDFWFEECNSYLEYL